MNESNIQQNTGKPNDEIDIFEFCSRMWNVFINFLVGIKDFFVSIIIFLIRKSLWIATFAVAGVIFGLLIHGLSRQSYSSLLEGFTGRLDNTVVIDHINKLSVVKGKPDILANFLNITEEQAKEVKNISAYYGIDINKDNKTDFIDFDKKFNPRDTNQLRVPSYVYIQVSVYDESIFPALRQGLLQYIKSNTYISELFKISRDQQLQMISQIDVEIQRIDSLQQSRFRRDMHPNTHTIIMGAEPELRLFHEEKLGLLARKQHLERELEVSDEIITVIHDFTTLALEDNPKMIFILIFGGAMAVMGVFCALIWQYRKRIWKLITEDTTVQ